MLNANSTSHYPLLLKNTNADDFSTSANSESDNQPITPSNSKPQRTNPWKNTCLDKYKKGFFGDNQNPFQQMHAHRKRFSSCHSSSIKPVKNKVVKYKTEICKNFQFSGECAFGDSVSSKVFFCPRSA